MENPSDSTRRKFIQQSVLGAAGISASPLFQTFPGDKNSIAGKDIHFLFQGDSITDGNRSRNMDWNHVLGHGYAYLIAARILYEYPENGFHFYNRGVSGDQITDLLQRWEVDTIALKPDLISILIGVNDTMNAVNGNKKATIQGFENDYRILLEKTISQLPGVELVICETFILPVGRIKEQWSDYTMEITGRQEASKKIAGEFKATFIPLQLLFNEAADKYPPADYWTWDGIHPMPNGHELIAREWIKQIMK